MSDTEPSAQVPPDAGRTQGQDAFLDEPITPRDHDAVASSQISLPSTEGPASPIEASQSFKTEANDERITASSVVIRSSLTPPPSSQVPLNGGDRAGNHLGYANPRPVGIFSPPETGLATTTRRCVTAASDFAIPTPQQVAEASADELRNLLQSSIAEHSRLKMEAAHYKLQFNLLSIQADEDAKRAAVEHEMTRREVEALRDVEYSRHARRELSDASESVQTKYMQLKVWYDQAIEENEALSRRLKAAKKVIQQKEDEIVGLTEERDMLLNRIRENREHFHLFRERAGIFNVTSTPKAQPASSPVQFKSTPRQTPKSTVPRDSRAHVQEPFDVLLKAATQENNSAPSTPTSSSRFGARTQPKHVRNVQSMSSLPSTPTPGSRGAHLGLLPSVRLMPQSEPQHRHSRYIPETPRPARHHERRKSRESTISADDNEEIARQALNFFASHGPPHPPGEPRRQSQRDDEEAIYESQASQAATEMLRRDPRESFEVAASAGASRESSPAAPAAAAEKSAKLQAKLFAGLNKSGVAAGEKRKFSGAGEDDREAEELAALAAKRESAMVSPTKKLRVAGGLRDPGRVGLGIQYGHEV
ncbi:hypothetical protein VTK73DRAFT_8399 [Phialemonium thermophilum]|uniref:FAD-dependent oxidoreductase-like enzyme n=1 Tax=Phialemonium thermophilum TaxID=223376 RepID=A0ABR3W8Y3_9PEZI